MRQQVEELEHEAHVVPAQAGPLAVGEGRQRPAEEEHLAGGRRVDPGGEVEERRLAGAAPAGDRHDLAGLDLAARFPQRAQHRAPCAAVLAGHAAEGEDGRRHVPPF